MDRSGQQRQTSEILESIDELSRMRNFLQSQIDDCLVKSAVRNDKTTTESSDSGDVLAKKIEKKRIELLDEKARQNLKNDVLKTLLYSQEAYRSVYPSLFPPNEEDVELSNTLRSSIRQKLLNLHEINKKILDLQDKKTKLRQRNHQLDLEIKKIIEENRESMNILQVLNEKNNQEKRKQECELKVPEVQQAKVKFENEIRHLRTVKYIFQCLIQASKLDWFEDKELYDLVIKLGQNDQDLLSNCAAGD